MSFDATDPRVRLLRELADPVRLRVIDRLAIDGPATVSRLAAELRVTLPQLSNHLRRLREAGLVAVHRDGRQAVYSLADPGLESMVVLLDSLTGRVLSRSGAEPAPPEVPSRTCYEHLGGRIGVAIYRGLRECGALVARPDGVVELGPRAAAKFSRLGVDLEAIEPGRRRFAYECLDATERAPHLAGALGDAVAGSLIARGWIAGTPGSRVITVTPAGRRELRRALLVAPA
jgi:DNA-binding transcriptional ArsR family regulator